MQADGGTSVYGDDDIPNFALISSGVTEGGVGPYDAVTLRKLLTGKSVRVSPSVGTEGQSISGSASLKDAEQAVLELWQNRDGLDSLVSVPILTSMVFVGLVAYVSGNFIFSQYLSVPYLPGCDELFPIATAIAGSLLAYLWFNSPPAEIYMGDAGSVGFGAAIGIMFILVQAGLFLPIVCIIIIAEACSVLLQISWFKFTKKTSGTGKRIFLCAPLHHHYQKKWEGKFPSKPLMNSKIVWRMHLVSIFALIFSMVVFFGIR